MKLPRLNTVRHEDCLPGMRKLPDGFVDLVFTSPPYADLRDYASIRPDDYVGWFLPIAYEIRRLLKDSGSFVLNINDRCVRRSRHLYVFKLVVALVETVKLPLIETYIWQKPNPMPGRFGARLKDAFEYCFWFGKTTDVKFRPEHVAVPYANARPRGKTIKKGVRNRFLQSGSCASAETVRYRNGGQRMNGATIYERGFADPGNVVPCAVTRGESNHPARMPDDLARFFINLATDPGDVVLDPFMGSGTTARAAKALGRKYLGFEIHPEYLDV